MQTWRAKAHKAVEKFKPEELAMRERLLSDFWFFIRAVNPHYVYGDVHERMCKFFQRYKVFGRANSDEVNKFLALIPRAHLKSHIIANFCAWAILRDPELIVTYVSASSRLSKLQLTAIKNSLTSPTVMALFPEYIHSDEGKRTVWNQNEIRIDHWKAAGDVRDPTVTAVGVDSIATGTHCDILIFDDLVVPENNTEVGREKVKETYSFYNSILNPGGFCAAVGTRYHGGDIYNTMKEESYELYGDDGIEIIGVQPAWDILEEQVETDGVFIWPATRDKDADKVFGFNNQILARIRASYTSQAAFKSQYYNNPNSGDEDRIDRSKFQYWNQRLLEQKNGYWYYNDRRLNLFTAIDFAYSNNKRSDNSAIVVIGMDYAKNIYVLDMVQFKTTNMGRYIDEIKLLHSKWEFRRMRAETSAAQQVIVGTVKEAFRDAGLPISIEEFKPTRHDGAKEARMAAVLEPVYEEGRVLHPKHGLVNILEDQLVQERPSRDDLKDALANAIATAFPPKQLKEQDASRNKLQRRAGRFGGVR